MKGNFRVHEPIIDRKPPICHAWRTQSKLEKLDGDLTKDFWTPGEWLTEFHDIEGDTLPRPWKQTKVKVLWDDEALYVGAQLTDDTIWATETDPNKPTFIDNDFEIFLAPQDSSHRYYEMEMNALNVLWDLFMERPQRDCVRRILSWDVLGIEHAVKIEGKLNDPSADNKFWSVEVKIPWFSLRECGLDECYPSKFEPKVGEIWRMDFSRVEYDVDVRDGGSMLVGITGLMHLYQIVRTKARRDVEQGRIAEARQDAADLMAFASKMSDEAETRPTWMIASSFRGAACSIALDILATGKASDVDLVALKMLVGERTAAKFDVRRLVYADFRYSLTRQLWRGPNPSLRERYSLHPNRTLAEIIVRLQEVVAMSEKGYDRTIGSQRASGDGMMPGQWCLFPNAEGRSFADMFLESWLSWSRLRALDAFGCLAAETCLAAEQFRRANGRAPTTLEELVPKFLSAVPLDPFESSRPLSYDAERGVIWTVGSDGDYNGQMRTSKQIMSGSKYARRLDGRRIKAE